MYTLVTAIIAASFIGIVTKGIVGTFLILL